MSDKFIVFIDKEDVTNIQPLCNNLKKVLAHALKKYGISGKLLFAFTINADLFLEIETRFSFRYCPFIVGVEKNDIIELACVLVCGFGNFFGKPLISYHVAKINELHTIERYKRKEKIDEIYNKVFDFLDKQIFPILALYLSEKKTKRYRRLIYYRNKETYHVYASRKYYYTKVPSRYSLKRYFLFESIGGYRVKAHTKYAKTFWYLFTFPPKGWHIDWATERKKRITWIALLVSTQRQPPLETYKATTHDIFFSDLINVIEKRGSVRFLEELTANKIRYAYKYGVEAGLAGEEIESATIF